jgi:hypothetical protein
VPDQPLEVVPVAGTGGLRRAQAEHAARADVHPGDDPLGVVSHQFQVGGADQAGVRHVDEPVAQYGGAQQHLAVPALEVAQREPRAGQPQRVAVEAAHLVDRHEDLAPADRGHQAGDQRVVRAAEPDDDVGQPTEGPRRRGRCRPFDQARQAQRSLAARRGTRPGGRWRGHG